MRRISALCVLASLATLVVAASALPYAQYLGAHWSSSSTDHPGGADPTLYYFTSSPWDAALSAAVSNWDSRSGRVNPIVGPHQGVSDICSGYASSGTAPPYRQVYVCNLNVPSSWCGLTNSWVFANYQWHFYSATVRLNDQSGCGAWGATSRMRIACHELGHVWGLAHNTQTSSCLYPVNQSNVAASGDGNDIYWLDTQIYGRWDGDPQHAYGTENAGAGGGCMLKAGATAVDGVEGEHAFQEFDDGFLQPLLAPATELAVPGPTDSIAHPKNGPVAQMQVC